MRAVTVSDPGQPRVADRAEPTPKPGEMIVRVHFAAICGTDRKLASRGADPPRVPGHEISGVSDDGTPVGVHPDVGCAGCAHCRAGLENRCEDRQSIGLDRDGGLAELVLAPARHVTPLDGVPMEAGCLLEPLACAVHAVRMLDVRAQDSAVVVGAGAMGILCMWALQAVGARVAVCQRSPERRAQARDLGADAVLGVDEDPSIGLGEPPVHAIVTAPGAAAITWALERVAVGGAVHTFAGTPDGALVDANTIHYRHLRLVGSTGSSLDDYRRARELVAEGKVPLQRLPRACVSLDDAPPALVEAPRPDVLRTVVALEG